MGRTAVIWFRRDLRLSDNPALRHAVDHFDAIVPVFVWSPTAEGNAAPGAASRAWIYASLSKFARRLSRCGAPLVVRAGDPRTELPEVVSEARASAVFWNRRYEPALTALDADVAEVMMALGLETQSFKANLLFEPWEVASGSGGPYRVFSAFWKQCGGAPAESELIAGVRKLRPARTTIRSVPIEELGLAPRTDWRERILRGWEPGELGARRRLRTFIRRGVADYSSERDFPGLDSVSRLSPYLHHGELSPLQIVKALQGRGIESSSGSSYLRQLGWREFAHHVLYHNPRTPTEPLDTRFRSFSWRTDVGQLRAWQQGRTGYPIVDAGMRQLRETGWMHNRVRMIVASFLVKDLLISWEEGAAWFHDALVDADQANNTLGWQWAGGCGADAAPYFRIFNPVRQAEKFDSSGAYVRRWVPELSGVPDRWIHNPWDAPADVLASAGVELGRTYPHRIVEHAGARKEALRRFKAL